MESFMNGNAGVFTRSEYLVETDWLEEHLEDPDLRIFDCTAHPAPNPDTELRKKYPLRPTPGLENFDGGHIPGAGFLDVPGGLSDTLNPLPLTVPPARELAAKLQTRGVVDGSKVVLYSASSPIWAARVWWMLHSIGFDNAAILNGGWSKWIKEGRAVSTRACSYEPGHLSRQPRRDAFVGKELVRTAVGNHSVRLIHALSPSIFEGSNDNIIFGRRGRIPGSVNIPSGNLNREDGTYISPGQMRMVLDSALSGYSDRIITYCGGGINASNVAFALKLVGYTNVSVYDGSMSEWGNDETLPVEVGRAGGRGDVASA
jgi:thiosulfate/3-mercaptopyruvate sulfurtransferase